MTTFADQVFEFGKRLRSDGLSDRTIRAYMRDVMAFTHECQKVGASPDETTPDMLAECARVYINKTRTQVSAATTNRRIVSLRAFFRYTYDCDPLYRYKAPPPAPGKAHPLPNLMDDVRAMLAVAKREARVAIALCGFAGLRVDEARNLKLDDVDFHGLMITVHGKGEKTRYVPLAPELYEILSQHRHQHGQDNFITMTDRGVRAAITRAGLAAGIGRPVASHDLRMTFGTVVYDKTKDLRVTQELLGHSDPKTTERYTGITEAAKVAAVAAALP
jgi:integrase/recombinase XerD